MNTKNFSRTIVWFDPDNRDSYKICLPYYGLTCLMANDISEDEVEITIYGPTENMAAFLKDLEEDAVEPLDTMSTSLEFDEDYEGWLNNEVYAADMAYIDSVRSDIESLLRKGDEVEQIFLNEVGLARTVCYLTNVMV